MCAHTKRNEIGRAMLMVIAGLIVAGLMAAQGRAQSFTLSQNGKSVGTASLQMNKAASGVEAASNTKIDMPGLKYSFSEKASLDSIYRLASAQLNGSVNGTSAKADVSKQGQNYSMKIDANGGSTNTLLAFHPNAVFLPDFDPAGLQAILDVGAARNNRDLWALIPKQTGSITPLRIATDADMQGTLNGKSLMVNHFTVTYDTSKTELFSSPANELLQAEWTDEGFAMVRQGFKLTPPARPTAPPPAAPQQPAGQQGQAPQPQQQ